MTTTLPSLVLPVWQRGALLRAAIPCLVYACLLVMIYRTTQLNVEVATLRARLDKLETPPAPAPAPAPAPEVIHSTGSVSLFSPNPMHGINVADVVKRTEPSKTDILFQAIQRNEAMQKELKRLETKANELAQRFEPMLPPSTKEKPRSICKDLGSPAPAVCIIELEKLDEHTRATLEILTGDFPHDKDRFKALEAELERAKVAQPYVFGATGEPVTPTNALVVTPQSQPEQPTCERRSKCKTCHRLPYISGTWET